MHGFIASIEQNSDRADRMRQWMAAWIQIEPKKRSFEIRQGPFSYMGSMEPEARSKPVATDRDGLLLAYNGFIARDQLKDGEQPEPETDSEVAAALLRLYRQKGAAALAALNGRYLVIVWDPNKKSLELMNDILGLKPVFIWQKDHSLACASNVWAMACHPRFRKVIDSKGLVDLLLLSHQQGNRTLFKDVSLLPPGSVLTVSDGNVTSRLVRNLKFSDERWGWSIENVAEEMYALLSRSVRRRVPDGSQVLLPLSGGFDSRSLLGLLLERPVEVRAITYSGDRVFVRDAKYARRLARFTGVSHQLVPLRYRFLARYRSRSVAISGGLYDIHTGLMLCLLEESEKGSLPIVSGHLGGELTGAFQISDALFSTREEHFDLAFRWCVNDYRFAPEHVRKMLSPDVPRDLVDEAVQDNRQFFMSQQGTFFQRFCNWDLLLTRRRHISYQLFYHEQFGGVVTPFYDIHFVDFMCSLPFTALEKQRAYRVMLRRRFPALAAIPNAKDLPILTSDNFRCFLAAQYRRFVLGPLRRVRRHSGTEQIRYYGLALRGASESVIQHILQNKDRIAPYLNPDRVEDAVNRHLSGDNCACMGLLGLSAFVTALEFLEDPYMAVRTWSEGPTEARTAT